MFGMESTGHGDRKYSTLNDELRQWAMGITLSRNGLPEIVMSCHINVDKVGYMSGKSM